MCFFGFELPPKTVATQKPEGKWVRFEHRGTETQAETERRGDGNALHAKNA